MIRKRKVKTHKVWLRGKVGKKVFTFNLFTDSPNVNLSDERCFVLNVLSSGRIPPTKHTNLWIDEPSGWHKMRTGFYVKNRNQLNYYLRRYKRGQPVRNAYAKKFRPKPKRRKK